MTTHATYGEHTLAIDDRTGQARKVSPTKLGPHNGVVRREAVAPAPGPRVSSSVNDQPKYRSKLEAQYAGHLEALRHVGDVRDHRYEALRLILAKDCTLTPDFLVRTKDGAIEFHETKGFLREDAMIKLRVAARLFPFWKFILVTRKKSVWEYREIGA